jgi:6-phosphogluconolactonase
MPDITTIPNADDTAVAIWLEERLTAAIAAASGEIAINVPGGSTPFPIFAILAKSSLDWSRIAVWPGDDRMVAQDNPASNIGRIREALEPAGMGPDGHIASLFPNTDPQADDAMLVRQITPDPLPPEAPFDRVSLTIPALLNCDELAFVIRGDDKRAVFDAAAQGESDLPIARLLRAARQKVSCFT